MAVPDLLKKVGKALFEAVIWLYWKIKHAADYVGEMMTGGFLIEQKESLVYGTPLGGPDSTFSEIKEFAIKERDLLITESFSVQGTEGPYCNVSGIELLISGTDTLKFWLADRQVACIQNTRGTNHFTVYREDTDEVVGKIEKVEDVYGFYGKVAAAPTSETDSLLAFSSSPEFTLTGDFIDRRFNMMNRKNELVAKVKKQVIAFPAFDHYTVRIAPGMDPILVIACLCVIDEDLEDKLKDKILYVPSKVVGIGYSVAKTGFSFINPFR